MSDLLTRLEGLEKPCRECDAEIMLLSGEYKRDKMRPGQFFHKNTPNISGAGRSKYTSSLDAIVGLIERDLPGWCRSLDHSPNRGYRTHMFNPDDPTSHGFASQHKLEAVAYCLTYVKAKEATRNASEVK